MSFLTGSNDTESNVNSTTEKGQKELVKFLQKMGYGAGLFPGTGSVDTQPFTDLFTMQNTHNFAQAKESAGNLTGSGFAEVLGKQAGDAATSQGAFLSEFVDKIRARNQGVFLQALISALGSPAAGVTQVHTPGLLDYATSGAQAAAPYLIGGPAGGVDPKGHI